MGPGIYLVTAVRDPPDEHTMASGKLIERESNKAPLRHVGVCGHVRPRLTVTSIQAVTQDRQRHLVYFHPQIPLSEDCLDGGAVSGGPRVRVWSATQRVCRAHSRA